MSSLNAVRAGGPFVVAHRAGNDLRLLRRAERARVAVIEADLQLYAGRIEVRHLKTVGPVPILWDRWKLAPPWAPRLLLDRLLQAAAPSTLLMLDLKGRDPRLALRVAAALRDHPRQRTVCCSQNWALLDAMSAVGRVDLVHSVGSSRQLAALRKLAAARSVAGISIHKRLVSPEMLTQLRREVGVVMAWPVLGLEEAERLVAWGVDGLITKEFDAVAEGLGPGYAAEEAA
jgi:glycerophosphoryl diester phosphodiesterase